MTQRVAAPLLVAVVITVLANLPIYLVGALAGEINAELGFPPSSVSLAVAAFWVASAVISLCVSASAYLASSRLIPAASMGLAALSLLGIGTAVEHWQWIVIWAAAGGAANGLSHPASNSIIAGRMPPRRIGIALGAKQAAIPAAGMISGLSLPALEPVAGWRGVFIFASAAALLFLARLLLRPPHDAPPRRGANHPSLDPSLRKHLMVVAVAAFLAATAANTVPVFAVVGAAERGLAPHAAGLLLSAGSIMAGVTRISLGLVADRGRGGGLGTMGVTLSAAVVGLALMALPGTLPYILGFMLAVGIGWGWSGISHLVVTRAAGAATAAGTGIVQVGAFAGNAAGPVVAGTVMTAHGQPAAWLVLAGVGAFAVAVTAIAPLTRPGHKPDVRFFPSRRANVPELGRGGGGGCVDGRNNTMQDSFGSIDPKLADTDEGRDPAQPQPERSRPQRHGPP